MFVPIAVSSSCPERVVVGVDFESAAARALAAALDHAARHPLVEIHVVHVEPRSDRPSPPSTALSRLETWCEPHLAEARRRHPHASFRRIVAHRRAGAPSEHIVRLASDLDADLVVVGARDASWIRRLLVASTVNRVVRTAPCPVFVARAKNHGPRRAQVVTRQIFKSARPAAAPRKRARHGGHRRRADEPVHHHREPRYHRARRAP